MPDQPTASRVEQLARALAGAAVLNPQRDAPGWSSLDDAARGHYRKQARRILRQTGVDGARTTPDNPATNLLRDLYAAVIYEHNNPARRWADAHPDDLLAYGGDADAVMAVRDQQQERLRSLLAEAVDWIQDGELRERISAALNPQEAS